MAEPGYTTIIFTSSFELMAQNISSVVRETPSTHLLAERVANDTCDWAALDIKDIGRSG